MTPSDRPMVLFLASDLRKLLKQLLVRFMKEDVVESLSLAKLTELDVSDKKIDKLNAKIHCRHIAQTVATVQEMEGICPYSIILHHHRKSGLL